MPKQDPQMQRKVEHLFLAEKYFTEEAYADFDGIRLLHNALPELRVKDINLSTDFLGTKMALPIYFNAITGGSRQSLRFNTELAQLAQRLGIPVSSGSMGVFLRLPEETKNSFTTLRENNPNGFVIANVSGKVNAKQAQQAIDLVQADALDSVIETGLESAPETESHKLAQKVKAKKEAGETITDTEVGRLYSENVKAIREEETRAAETKTETPAAFSSEKART